VRDTTAGAAGADLTERGQPRSSTSDARWVMESGSSVTTPAVSARAAQRRTRSKSRQGESLRDARAGRRRCRCCCPIREHAGRFVRRSTRDDGPRAVGNARDAARNSPPAGKTEDGHGKGACYLGCLTAGLKHAQHVARADQEACRCSCRARRPLQHRPSRAAELRREHPAPQ